MSKSITKPYLSGGYAPLRREYDDVEMRIEGRWPKGLTGTLYRIGPSPRFEPSEPYNPLNADGMAHAFRIGGGRASYRNRWVRTTRWRLEDAAGRRLFGTSGAPWDCDESVRGVRTDGAANTNIVWHAGRLLALEEGNPPFRLDAGTLETVGCENFDGALPANMTAHPKIDPVTGEMLFFANFPGGRLDGTIVLYRADAAGRITGSTVLQGPHPAMVHDFAVTADFIVVPVSPATLSLERIRAGGPPLAWEPALGMHVTVIPRRGEGADARWFEAPARMVWHLMNAFNDGERIVVDVCEQASAMFPLADGTPPVEAAATQRLARWTLDWGRPGTFDIERLSEARCEYPRLDERFAGREQSVGFVACEGGPGSGDPFHRGIGRFDFRSREMEVWSAGARAAVAEPVFVPRAPGAAEGDGWLLVQVFEEKLGVSCLAVLDARDVAAGPVARAWLEHAVPIGFHGNFRAG